MLRTYGRSGGWVLSYQDSLAQYAAFYLVLDLFVVVAFGLYRVRVFALLGGISPDLLSAEGLSGYVTAALAADVLATALAMTVLAGTWLLAPILRAAAVILSLLSVFACSAFTVFAADFLRVYQAAFAKSYVGGEHLTGINSVLISAAAELSSASRVALVALTVVLATASIVALGRRSEGRLRWTFQTMKIASFAASLVLAIGVLADCLPASRVQGKILPSARARGTELGSNPVVALVFGPKRETFLPPARATAVPAYYNTDSVEKAGSHRPLPAVRKGRYSVILYFCESTSWRYYDLLYDGKPVLPVLHALARNGVLLKNHYTNYPLSANTLYSVLSSRYSMYGKAMIFGEYHDVDVDTLPEVLARNGYATCFIHTGDLLYASRNKFLANRNIDRFLLEKDLAKDARYRTKVGWGADERSMIGPAVEWIKAQNSPYLLMLAPVNPHHPYAIPDDVEKITDPDEAGIGARERTWRRYLNSLHYTDQSMGSLIERLEREGLMKNTLFVVVGDHGEAFYQHPGNYNHPLYVYEENVHVPALFYSKSLFPAGIEMESITRHIDIMPSILDLLGVADTARRDGESIFSRSMEKMAVFHTSWTDELMGVRDGRWKYILRMKDSREELYNLEADPGETANIADANPEVALRYRKVADDMVSYMLAQYRGVARKAQSPTTARSR